MRHLTSRLSLAVLLLSGCGPTAEGEGYEKLAPRAGPITVSNGYVKAQWSVVRDPAGVDSRGTGGACLIQKATDLGGPETCEPGAPSFTVPGQTMSKWYAYKAPDGTCWVKPGWACNRSPDYAPDGPRRWEVGTYPASRNPISLFDSYQPKAVGAETHWRVVACINGYDPALRRDNGHCGNRPATGAVFSEAWSDPFTLKRPPTPPPVSGFGITTGGSGATIGSGPPSDIGSGGSGATIGSGTPSEIGHPEGQTINGH